MEQKTAIPDISSSHHSTSLPIYFLFLFSGMSALMYEVIWMKELTLIMGNTVQSTTTVLAAFMAGLALGSLLFGRLVDRPSVSPVALYGYLELGIGLFAFLFPFLLREFQHLYITLHHALGLSLLEFAIIRFLVSFLLLLIPTILMGATLPVLSKYVEEGYNNIGKKIGLLYAINTLGAVAGILVTGYLLLGLYGITTTTRLAILINLLVALLAFFLWMRGRQKKWIRSPQPAGPPGDMRGRPAGDAWEKLRRIALMTYFLSGFAALGYEVLWMRVFIPFLHSSTYSFATMLAAFLTGLALGSWVFAYFVDRWKSLITILGWTQILIGFLILVSIFSFYFYYRLLSRYLDLTLESMTPGSFLINFLYFFIILIPPCFLMGGVFPVIIKIISGRDTSGIGTGVGNAYCFNTVGAILGSVITGFVFIPLLGVHRSLMLFMIVNIALGICLILFARWQQEGSAIAVAAGAIMGTAIILTALIAGNVFLSIHKAQVTHNMAKIFGPRRAQNELIFYKEGTTANISVVELKKVKNRLLLVNSIIVSGKGLTTKLMAHLPYFFHPEPRKALVICFGVGTTFRSLTLHGMTVHAVELVPEEIETFSYFYEDADRILSDPRNTIEINDGRNHLMLSREQYDIITIDPSPPLYSSGTVNLYTPEFFRLCRDRLSPQGVMCMWFFLPSCRTSEFQMLLKSFLSVFPNTTIWKSPYIYGVYAIGTKDPLRIDRESLLEKIRSPVVQDDLKGELRGNVSFDEDFLADMFMFNSDSIWELVKDGPDLKDDTPYIEHPLVTWWRDPTRLDLNRLFHKQRDDYQSLLTSSRQ